MPAARKAHAPRPTDAQKSQLSTLVATKAHQRRLAAGRTERAPGEPLEGPITDEGRRLRTVRNRIEDILEARRIGCSVEDIS